MNLLNFIDLLFVINKDRLRHEIEEKLSKETVDGMKDKIKNFTNLPKTDASVFLLEVCFDFLKTKINSTDFCEFVKSIQHEV